MLLRRPEAFTHHDAQLSEVRLHYLREGQGPALLLLHGWPGFSWEWHKNIGPLAEHFDVIVPDMRGFGDSEKPPLERIELYHTERVVKDYLELLDLLGVERCFLVGHDFGSEVAHKLIRCAPERIVEAVIINPSAPGWTERYLSPEHFGESWYAMFHCVPMAVRLVGVSRETVRIYYRHFFSHWSYDKDLFTDEEIEIYVDNFLKPGNIEGGFNFYKMTDPWTAKDRTISDCPVLFLQGDADPVAPARWIDAALAWYTKATLEVIQNAGHFVMRERPDLVNARIIETFIGKA